jgi:thiol:disulfide interchange protein
MIRAALFTLAAIIAASAPAHSAITQKFDRAAFTAAQTQGRPILVEVKAWWCPVCASQGRTIASATKASAFDKLVIFEINYDSQKPEWKSFNVRKQATLIGFRGDREVGRIEFQTDKALIGTLLSTTVR